MPAGGNPLHKYLPDGGILLFYYATDDDEWTLLTKVETSCDMILIAGGTNVEAEWEQGPAV